MIKSIFNLKRFTPIFSDVQDFSRDALEYFILVKSKNEQQSIALEFCENKGEKNFTVSGISRATVNDVNMLMLPRRKLPKTTLMKQAATLKIKLMLWKRS